MSKNNFIKVLTFDEDCCDSVAIVNKNEIVSFELTNYYEEEFSYGTLFLSNGREIFVKEKGIEELQKELLKGKIPLEKKPSFDVSVEMVDNLLSNNQTWKKTVGVADRMREISALTDKYKEEIAEKIKLMSYQDFLQTPYWRAISVYLKIIRKKCELCGSTYKLHTHHKTYEHHGYELLHLNDLQVVCASCHDKIHEEEKNK